MSRTETAQRLTTSAVDKRVDGWSAQMALLQTMQTEVTTAIESLALQKSATAEDMAKAMLPVAESMARLTEETRQTLGRIVSQSQQGHKAATEAIATSTKAAKEVASDLGTSMLRVQDQVQRLLNATQAAQENPPVNPWGPAIIAALLPTTAVLWLAWKLNLIP
jgi:molecular chaperone GrpE (heat shock protein)